MSFIFNISQRVPSKTIEEIGKAIAKEVDKNLKVDDDLKAYIRTIMMMSISKIATFSEPIVEGYKLTACQVSVIAGYLDDGQKVSAIREFRLATGSNLRESKGFIEKFGTGPAAAKTFMRVFGL